MGSAVKSAARAIEVLKYFSSTREAKGLKAICLALGYPQSSTTVLLKTLTSYGYLNYDRVRRVYFPTLEVTHLGDWVPAALFGKGEALDIMRDLHYATNETVVLAIANDIYIQYIAVIESPKGVRFPVPEGSMRLVTNSAIGWALMATLKEREADNLIRRANLANKDATSLDVKKVLGKVKAAGIHKYAYAEDLPFLGCATICVILPLLVQGKAVALALGGLQQGIHANFRHYLSLMQTSVNNILERNEREPRGNSAGRNESALLGSE
jgi:DNA-binding IclR family transcriptional regulator